MRPQNVYIFFLQLFFLSPITRVRGDRVSSRETKANLRNIYINGFDEKKSGNRNILYWDLVSISNIALSQPFVFFCMKNNNTAAFLCFKVKG
jgi:hypothetical protein